MSWKQLASQKKHSILLPRRPRPELRYLHKRSSGKRKDEVLGDFAAGIAPYVLSIFGWLWAAGFLFNANLKPDLRLRTGFFRFAIVYVACGLVFGLPIFWASNQIQQRWLLLPQFFGFICIIYILNFTAKAFVTLNRGRRSLLWNYGGDMIQFLALPLFVWKIQPRINRLYATAQKRVV
jgi:hypothetical protein